MAKVKRVVFRFIKRLAKKLVFGFYFPWVYKKAATQGIDGLKVLFLENKQTSLPGSFKVLYDYLEECNIYSLKFISLGQNRVGRKRYFLNCCDAIAEIATAKYIFLNDASDIVSCLPLCKETKVTQLWHACGAFKKWGMSTADLIFGGSRKDLLRHPFYKNLSLVTVSSPEVSWAYIEAMVLEESPEIVKPLGVSRTDLFFDEGYFSAAKNNIEKFIPQYKDKKIILYAPTFRGRVASAKAPDRLDIEGFRRELSDDYILLINHHPFVKTLPKIPETCKGFAFDVSGEIPIDELLICADLCISDYSSIVFEYSLFSRPILFFAYDIEEYSDWRGFYYSYEDLAPGPVFSTNDQLIDYIQNIDSRFDKEEVETFRKRFMSACDGNATERICNDVFGDDPAFFRVSNPHETMQIENPQGIDVSIVIPTYNAMPELTKGLKSIIEQSYDLSRVEVIVVDDCSTDSTWNELQSFAVRYPALFKIKRLEEQSGSPSKPRNVGLEIAQGTYVFFMDADDWLGPEAVERMMNHVTVWQSDILLVKMKGENGREVPKSMFMKNQQRVDIYKSKVMWSFAPLKLFRRSLIDNLRFPECMPEDIPFVLRAYCTAKTVSVAADYDYYHVSWRDEGAHESLSSWSDVDSNLAAYMDIFGYIRDFVPEGERGYVLMRRLLRRDVYRTCITLAKSTDAKVARQYDQLVQMVQPFYTRESYRTCPIKERVVLDAAILGDIEIMRKAVSLGDFLPQECTYELRDNALVCTFSCETGKISSDVTDAFRSNCRVCKVDVFEDAIELQGVMLVPQTESEEQCEMVLMHGRDQAAAFDVVLKDFRENESCNDIPCAKMSWNAVLTFDELITLDLSAPHRLVMVYGNGALELDTLGVNREAYVRQNFLELSYSSQDKCIKPFVDNRGSFLLKSVTLK